jgi:hypothetical protein
MGVRSDYRELQASFHYEELEFTRNKNRRIALDNSSLSLPVAAIKLPKSPFPPPFHQM